jgi:curved DNA-binding protein CbpA
MKINEAIHVLNITNYTIYNIKNISYNELKKHYHIQCLIYHPDKNIENEEATLIFQNINQAYNILKELINISKDDCNFDNINNTNATNINATNTNATNTNVNDYNYYILNFINFIINYYSNSENNSKLEDLEENINNIKYYANSHIKTILINLIDNFSIVILEDLYIFLLKYKKECICENNTLSDNIITTIKTILQEKLSKYNIYILTPNIVNLLNSDVYKLTINNDIIYIPLWHNELNFENNIIKIEPVLDNNITLDIDNNIHYTYTNTFNNILDLLNSNTNITINIENYAFNILISKLTFSKYQIYSIKNQGLSKINTNNILDNTCKSDIIFHIYLS